MPKILKCNERLRAQQIRAKGIIDMMGDLLSLQHLNEAVGSAGRQAHCGFGITVHVATEDVKIFEDVLRRPIPDSV